MCIPDCHLSNAEKPSSLITFVQEIFFSEFSLSISGADNSLVDCLMQKRERKSELQLVNEELTFSYICY